MELETIRRAKWYMDKLARGIDPITDREIGEDSVVNNARLVRCFLYVSDVLQSVIDNGGSVGYNRKKKREFAITPQQLASVRPTAEFLRISEFTRLLHQTVGDPEMKQLNPTRFTNWLLDKGFLENSVTPEGKMRRMPTEAGRRIGIRAHQRQGAYDTYMVVLYDKNAQQFLLDHYWEIVTA